MSSLTSVKANKFKSMMMWFAERFPALNIISAVMLFFVMYGAIRTMVTDSMQIGWGEVIASIAVATQFLLLRILDEFKDYDEDCINHPDRVLQKGLISLGDLKLIAVFCIGFQIFTNFWFFDPFNVFWAAMVIWTGLMAKEFFVHAWLKKHLFIYLFSHMLVMPLMCLWVSNLYVVRPERFWPVFILIFIGSVLFELTRKTRGLDENPNLDSYPKEIGMGRHATLLILVTAAVVGSKQFLLISLGMEASWFLWVEVLAALLLGFSIFSFYREPLAKNRKKLEGVYGLLMLVIYLHFIYITLVG